MASVVWTQLNNGVQSGAETAAVQFGTSAEARDFLAVKAASHTASGWIVAWSPLLPLDEFTAYKVYPNLTRKDRTFTAGG